FEYMAAKEHISINAPGWLDWLIEQLEQARTMNHNMWTCGDCGFSFDASHTDEGTDGQYSCPACAEIELEKQLEQAQAAMQWQSLETIPKDGISILVLDADGSVYEASWNGWGWDYP